MDSLNILTPLLPPASTALSLDTKEPGQKKDGSTVYLNLALAILATSAIKDLTLDRPFLTHLSKETSFTAEQVHTGNIPKSAFRGQRLRCFEIAAASSQIWDTTFATVREPLISKRRKHSERSPHSSPCISEQPLTRFGIGRLIRFP
jgi:hypothetical protein